MTVPPGWRVRGLPGTPGRLNHLRPTLEALGVECSGGVEERLQINGTLVSLRLVEDEDDQVVALRIETEREGARRGTATIRLTRENDVDRLGKTAGHAREVQLGDDAFDALVYVESEGDDHEVERALGRPGVREAARALIEAGAGEIVIDGQGVRTSLDTGPTTLAPDFLVTAIGWVLEVNRGGAPTGPALPGRGELAWNVSVGLVLPLGLALAWAIDTYPASEAVTVLGGLAGLIPAFLLVPLVTRPIQGTSSAHRLRRGITLAIVIDCALVCAALFHLIGGGRAP